MRIAALVHFAMPWRCAGSETVLHEMLKAAVAEGHEVTGFITDCGMGPPEIFDGVRLVRVRNAVIAGRQASAFKPDVMVSHHQHVLHAIRVARITRARSVYLTHNDFDINKLPLRMRPDLVIHNSAWVRDSLARFGEPKETMVFHPPLTPDRHTVPNTGEAYTLVNLNEHKGARFLYALAEALPDREFIGVVGGHGVQNIRRDLPNVTIMEHGPDMKRVWSRTKVLLMPSVYESYGLVAVEAAVNGIPTIANATPGLLENIGPGGTFVQWGAENLPTPYHGNEKSWHTEWAKPSQGHIAAWVDTVNRLDDDYPRASEYARQRTVEAMDATRDTLKTWLEWIARQPSRAIPSLRSSV